MQTLFLAALGFALVAVMFALQNVVPVKVTFLAWTFEGALAVVLFVAFIMGALTSAVVSAPAVLKGRINRHGFRRGISASEGQLTSGQRDDEGTHARTITPSTGKPTLDVAGGRDFHAVRPSS